MKFWTLEKFFLKSKTIKDDLDKHFQSAECNQ